MKAINTVLYKHPQPATLSVALLFALTCASVLERAKHPRLPADASNAALIVLDNAIFCRFQANPTLGQRTVSLWREHQLRPFVRLTSD